MVPSSRSLLIGMSMFVALAALAFMIFLFGQYPHWLRAGYRVSIKFPDGVGPLLKGADVKVEGVIVGRIIDIKPLDDFRGGVLAVAEIDQEYRIPQAAKAAIVPAVIGIGKPYVEIVISRTEANGYLPQDNSAMLAGELRTGFEGLVPPEMGDKLNELVESLVRSARGLDVVTSDLHQLLEPRPLPAVAGTTQPSADQVAAAATQPASPLANLSTVVQRLDQALLRINVMFAAGTGDVPVILANLREASVHAKAASESFRQFNQKAIVVADNADRQIKRIGDALYDASFRLAGALDKLNAAMQPVADGRGTLGRLMKDPALYEELLLTADRLNRAVADLQQLIRTWQAEGMGVKLK